MAGIQKCKEANPKAAFQFGVKMSEGRKTHKDLGKNRDQKLSNQLGKIKNIMEKDVSLPCFAVLFNLTITERKVYTLKRQKGHMCK